MRNFRYYHKAELKLLKAQNTNNGYYLAGKILCKPREGYKLQAQKKYQKQQLGFL